MTPPLTIVIPSHSRADLLQLCLASACTHAPANTEILVVDDASRDGIISQTAARFPGVRTIRLPKRSGFCIAANTGIAAATGDVVELLNDDTEVTANWADAALRWFADSAVGAVAPLVLQHDPDQPAAPRIDSAGDEYDPGGFARKRWNGRKLGEFPDLSAGPVWGVSATAGFYRRSVLLATGGFPTDFGAYFEDVDLSCRIRKLGHTIWFEPTSIVRHRVSASYGKRPSRRILELQSRNEERVFWRNLDRNTRFRHLPRHAAVLAGKACRRLQEGTLVPWTLGRIRAWAGM